MAEKIIKGQPYIQGDSLVQDQTKITSKKAIDIPAAVIIEDIWDNLKNNTGSGPTAYKSNGKKDYFYWEVKQTSIESDDIEVTVNFECPKPKEGLYNDLLENNTDPEDQSVLNMGDYTAYWYKKIYTARKNYEKEMAIQKKEITFEPVTMTDYSKDNFGEVGEVVSGYTIKNDDLGDISNLLSLF